MVSAAKPTQARVTVLLKADGEKHFFGWLKPGPPEKSEHSARGEFEG